ncbi:MAG TPA: TonB-dependent receptor [Candidatus Angelobacter sp.]|nr:TonB-dependent receptor [Candidatus Angelobacter sp.]
MLFSIPASASGPGAVRGVITDPLGAVVSGATVVLLQGNQQVAVGATDGQGNFQLPAPSPGHYRVRASAPGFASQDSPLIYIGGGRSAQQNLALKIGPVTQELVVSATGTAVPDSRTGASVSVIRADEFAERLDVLEPLRQVPGAQILQAGQRGTQGAIFLRGGDSNASKVLVDGIPMNDIGGVVNLGTLATTGVERIEVLRGPNSALFGSDAMAGVVTLTTRRGVTPLPEISYALDGGNFHSRHQDGDLAGAFRRLDYFGEFSRFDTDNSIPNNTFNNATYVANLGLALNATTELRLTGRYTTTTLGQPNTIQFFAIPDDSSEHDQDGYLGVTLQNQTTPRWHNLLRYTATRLRIQDVNPTPTGIPFDNGFGFGLNYLGQTVTIRGANGFSTTGQAILDFGGVYPMVTSGSTKQDAAYFQTDWSFSPRILGLLAFRYEDERGFTLNFGSKTPANRNNFSTIAEVHGSLGSRVYVTLGGSVEKNAVFGVAAVPRVSGAYYFVRPRSTGFFNGTKLKFNYGQGIRAPSISDQALSLFAVLSGTANGPQSIAQLGLVPISAERSRSFDVGLEQLAWRGRAKFAATFFYNRFTNQIEFVGIPGLQALGVPLADALATGFGATLNSGDTRALGAETEIDLALGHGFSVHAAYTYLDATLERSFTNDAFSCLPANQTFCAFNPAFPTVPIGAFAPLEGSRPFRRAPHTGSFRLAYARGRLTTAFSGTLVSRRDDSTFLSDPFFGNTMLLPNRNLDAAYQQFDWSGNFAVSRRVSLYAAVDNLASQQTAQVIGFPALPLTFRAGFRVRLGGEAWK